MCQEAIKEYSLVDIPTANSSVRQLGFHLKKHLSTATK